MVYRSILLAALYWLAVAAAETVISGRGEVFGSLWPAEEGSWLLRFLGVAFILMAGWWKGRPAPQGNLEAGSSQALRAADKAPHAPPPPSPPSKPAVSTALSQLFPTLMSPASSLKDIAASVLSQAQQLTGSEFGYVSAIDPASGENVAYALTDMMSGKCQVFQEKKTMVFPRRQDGTYPGLWGHALNTRQAFFTNAPTGHPAFSGLPQGHIPLVRFLSVPVLWEEELVGQIALANPPRDYEAEDVTAVQRLAEFYAMAIQRKRTEADLAAEKELLAVTLSSIGDGVVSTDAAGRLIMLNPVAEALSGWPAMEALGKPLAEVFHFVEEKSGQRMEDPLAQLIRENHNAGLSRKLVLLARDGTERIIAESGAPIRDRDNNILGVVLVLRDITEREKLSTELTKIDKLESLGVLAGGIAHDFNNILMAILGNISLATLYARHDEAVSERLAAAEEATYRARDLVQQLITFAKGGAPVKELASLAEIIRESAVFATRGSQATCEFSLPPDLWPVLVDPGQISQVVQNLVLNAVQAMPAGGLVRVSSENILLTEEGALPLKPGKYVKTTITDEGVGIPAPHLLKIFDPYFTTKERGSGLGLATVYSILKKHDGFITVDSEVGRGTSFVFYLPAGDHEQLPEKIAAMELVPGEGRILLMDDEEMVREVAGKMLLHLGFEVELAEDGATALQKYEEALAQGHPFDAVIMDLTVPGGMGGKRAIKRLLEIDPHARAIVSSGYAADPIMTNYREYGFLGCIRKPYKIDNLSRLLAQVLEKKEGSEAG